MSATTHEEDALGKAYDSRLMRRLLRYLRPYRGKVAIAILLLLAAAGLELVGPWLTKIAIDEAIPAGDRSQLLVLTLAFVGTLLAAFVLEFVQAILTTWLGQRVMFDLRREIFGHLQRLRLPFLDRCASVEGQNCDEYPVLTMYVMRLASWISGDDYAPFYWVNALLLTYAAFRVLRRTTGAARG